MENLRSTRNLIKRNARSGLTFKSGDTFYTVCEVSDLHITLFYFGSEEEIPWKLFYKVMYTENLRILILWRDSELSSDKETLQ